MRREEDIEIRSPLNPTPQQRGITRPVIRSPLGRRHNIRSNNNNNSPLTQIPHLYRREFPQPQTPPPPYAPSAPPSSFCQTPPPPYAPSSAFASSSTLPIAAPSALRNSSSSHPISFVNADKYAPSAPPVSLIDEMDDEFGDGNYVLTEKGRIPIHALGNGNVEDWLYNKEAVVPNREPMGEYVVTGVNLPAHTQQKQREQQKQSKWLMCCLPCIYNADPRDLRPRPFKNFFLTFTTLISVVQIVMLVVMILQKGFAPFSQNANYGPPIDVLVEFGAKVSYYMRYDYQVWRFVTPIFLHAGIIHIALNLFAQLRLGPTMERDWGRIRFLLIYFITGISAVLTSCIIQPNSVSVGASGSICGLVGAYLAEVILMWRILTKPEKKAQIAQFLIFVVTIGLLTLTPAIDSSAHFGGFITGIFGGFTLLADPNRHPQPFKFRFLFGAVVIAYLAFGFVWFFAFTSISPVYLPKVN
eukprot:TRINITY_DN2184_c0_g1_i1.p1 TRINITY_DN2184_c0_g1~~TRINITY_DN2184_c0_g1_i1.p1  ORF type:complete len:471 (-),score=105.36 TRINITY_DN2184_c0_g1_i1:65-1477(-)